MIRSRPLLTASALALLSALSLTAAPAAAAPAARPDLPDEQTLETGHFLIHYTARGEDAVDGADADGSGVPDYVELVAATLENVWQVEIVEMGWAPPPPAGGRGGAHDRIDVYLLELLSDDYAGYADTEGGFVGDNPLTPEVERRASSSYLALDNDYAGIEDSGRGEGPIELMQATAAHEFNHVIQAGYDDFDPQYWLYEATATWMEDEVYPDVNDGVYYLDDTFGAPDTCLVSEDGWYGNWLFVRMLSERYGRDVVREVWEYSRQMDNFDALDAALAGYGSSLGAEAQDYGVAMLLRDFQEGELYPGMFVEGTAGEGVFTPGSGVQGLGVDVIRLQGSGPVDVSVIAADSPLRLRAVAVRGAEADVIDAPEDTLTVDLGAYDEVFALVHNPEQTGDEEACFDSSYDLRVAASSGPPTPVAAVRSAARFGNGAAAASEGSGTYIPPTGQPFTGSGTDYVDSPGELDAGFDLLTPAFLPEGYAFDYAYLMTEADFGDSAPYYVPGGGQAANFDYYDEAENWLSIAQSPSPYAALQEWLDDVDYDTPGEFIQVSGVEVLMEDFSEGSDTSFSATLILEGLFIVVDGDQRDGVVGLIEGLVAASEGGPAPAEPEQPAPAGPEYVPPPAGEVAEEPGLPGIGRELSGMLGAGLCLLCGGGLCLGAAVIGGAALLLRRRPA